MNTFRALCAGLLLALFSVHAEATPFNTLSMDVGVCDPNNPQNCIKPDSSGNVPVTGTFSATLGGFTPSAAGARGTALSVTTSDSSGNLPTGAVVAVTNVGSNPMYCNVNGIAATVADQYISSSGGWFAFTIPNAITTLHCIATGGSTTANTVGGSGLPTGTGGGGGSGGGGAVTLASGAVASGAYSAGSYAAGAVVAGAFVDGWDVTQGTKADAAWVSGSGSVIALLKNIAGGVAGSIPAGTALIGDVNVRQGGTALSTTNGIYSNLLQGNAVLSATNGTFANMLQGNAVLSLSNPLPVAPNAYPVGATALTASATGTTAATTATLAGAVGKTTYICGYSIRANATATTTVTNTLTGVITATMSSIMWVPANTAGLGVDEQIFSPCIPASGTNQAIAAVSGAPGAGGVVSSKAWGYQQ